MNDIGLLVTIAASAKPWVYDNVVRSMRILKPRFSSIAVDLWLRPATTSSSAHAQRHVQTTHARTLTLFSHVEWLDTADRWSVPRHVRPSFSYRLHWQRVADRALRTAAPLLLAGLDADYVVPDPLPLAVIARLLTRASATLTPSRAMLAALEARARHLWLNGTAPPCISTAQQLGLYAPIMSPSHLGSITPCEVASAQRHSPLYVSPRRLSLLQIERAQSFGELTSELRPLRIGVSVRAARVVHSNLSAQPPYPLAAAPTPCVRPASSNVCCMRTRKLRAQASCESDACKAPGILTAPALCTFRYPSDTLPIPFRPHILPTMFCPSVPPRIVAADRIRPIHSTASMAMAPKTV